MPIEDASVDLRCAIDVADKYGLEGPGASFDRVEIAISVQSSAPPEKVQELIAHARRGCHAEQSLARPIPVTATATLNGRPLQLLP